MTTRKAGSKVKEIKLEPNWPGMLRWYGHALATHSFDRGSVLPVGAMMEIAGYLGQNEPETLMQIVREFSGDTEATKAS